MGTVIWFLLAWLAVVEAKKKCIYDKSTCGLPQAEYLKKHPEYKFDSFHDDDDENDPMRRKIMGGVRAEKGELPWSVSIRMSFIGRMCGGTLVTRRHVISAAHCFWGLTASLLNEDEEGCKKDDGLSLDEVTKKVKVLVGGTCTKVDPKVKCAKEDVGVEIGVKRAYYQDFFDKGCNFTNDIAILELSKGVPDGVNHICLPFMHDVRELKDPSLQLSSSGWGADPDKKYFSGSPFLQNVKLGTIMAEKKCKKLIPNKSRDSFCTYERPDTNVCHGDSGGGIVATVRGRSYLMGVVSYGTECNELKNGYGAPSAQVNTNIMHFISLIEKKTGIRNKKSRRA